jgi:hypothetical protein
MKSRVMQLPFLPLRSSYRGTLRDRERKIDYYYLYEKITLTFLPRNAPVATNVAMKKSTSLEFTAAIECSARTYALCALVFSWRNSFPPSSAGLLLQMRSSGV